MSEVTPWVFQCDAYSYDVCGIYSMLTKMGKAEWSGSAAELFALASSELPAGSLPATSDQLWELILMLYPIWPHVRVMCHIKDGQKMIDIYEEEDGTFFPATDGSLVFPIWMCQRPRHYQTKTIMGNRDTPN